MALVILGFELGDKDNSSDRKTSCVHNPPAMYMEIPQKIKTIFLLTKKSR